MTTVPLPRADPAAQTPVPAPSSEAGTGAEVRRNYAARYAFQAVSMRLACPAVNWYMQESYV
ncbi:hypothetical protein GA0070610_5593 [Micromonospora echinofusca]|uniref:Uncharacterized protein n=1 Tax=Micromonospora echinofusca TaxID=47858 RepID=A0A1C5GHJ6_MICEH|nr:hypothetical protein GA0070610_5593 [Micromonospora echinofusca]